MRNEFKISTDGLADMSVIIYSITCTSAHIPKLLLLLVSYMHHFEPCGTSGYHQQDSSLVILTSLFLYQKKYCSQDQSIPKYSIPNLKTKHLPAMLHQKDMIESDEGTASESENANTVSRCLNP